MWKILISSMIIFIYLIFAGVALASPLVIIDDKIISFDSGQHIIVENDRTLVPFRNIFEAMGADVQWDKDTQTVTAKKGDITISLIIDGPAYKNGEPIVLDVPAKIIKSRTMVPLRFVGEAFGATVNWDQDFQAVLISTSGTKNKILDNYLALNKTKLNEFLLAEAKEGHGGAVEKLLTAGADPNTSQNGNSALMFASGKGDTDTVKALIAAGADVNYKNKKFGSTVLSSAIFGEQGDNQADTVKVLLEAGVDPNNNYSVDWTPLNSAVNSGRTEVVKALLNGGADPNFKGKSEYPVIYHAMWSGPDQTEMIKALIKAGAKINAFYDDRTPLMIAATRNNHELVKFILESGADPNMESSDGLTALIIAKMRGYTDIINLLQKSGAEHNNGYLPYIDKTRGFKIQYPEKLFKKERNNTVKFYFNQENSSDVYSDNIEIIGELVNDKQTTLDEYVDSGLALSKKYSDFNVVELSETKLAGTPAKKIIITSKEGELSLKYLTICTIKDNRAYRITYTAETDKYPEYLKIFEGIIDSFEWIPGYSEE
ncbi:ankyrin repeat domain-containing protein [Pelotomaculum propionicicum]|uniref:ankyrin repeat domain-containing protein n=1 Tax=Pelotomaculum propionicicum TaxID=258475 RepID=UPI003B79DF95